MTPELNKKYRLRFINQRRGIGATTDDRIAICVEKRPRYSVFEVITKYGSYKECIHKYDPDYEVVEV